MARCGADKRNRTEEKKRQERNSNKGHGGAKVGGIMIIILGERKRDYKGERV